MIGTIGRKHFGWSRNERGLSIFFRSRNIYDKARRGGGPGWARSGWQNMESLLETGEANASPTEEGVFLNSADAARLGDEYRSEFELPPPWPGFFRVEGKSVPNLPTFDADLQIADEKHRTIASWSLTGPILRVGADDHFLLSASQYAALTAYNVWKALDERTEPDHLFFIKSLQDAADAGCPMILRGFGNQKVVSTKDCIIDVRANRDGSLELTPVLLGSFVPHLLEELSAQETSKSNGEASRSARAYVDALASRVHHLEAIGDRAIVRVGKTLILLDEIQTKQARAIGGSRNIPAGKRREFEESPEEWLANHQFAATDVEFLPRVIGIGEWVSGYLGDAGELGDKIDWFNKKPEPEGPPSPREPREEPPSPEDPEDPLPESGGPIVPLIEKNDDSVAWGIPVGEAEPSSLSSLDLDFHDAPRTPFPHQVEAITWLASHSARGGHRKRWRPDDQSWGTGALLADDMGLGKTLSALLFLGKWLSYWKKISGETPAATLVVAPLSLVENWREEISMAFSDETNPFSRVVLGIPAADLKKFHAHPGGRDIVQSGTDGNTGVKQYGLRFGDGTEASLDQPGTCVITTYQSLRDYRFSFAGCEWACAILDEAQNIKNPNAIQTIAAKALKAYYRLGLTGTPVENHLGDLWCLIDTIEPGYLNSYSEFRKTWISPLRKSPELLPEIGERLRTFLGPLILRRTKEESLEGLPKKRVSAPTVSMTPRQADAYLEILNAVAEPDVKDDSPSRASNRHIVALWELRRVTLHPSLVGDALPEPASSPTASRTYFRESGKLTWLLDTLDKIKDRNEKVLIFAIQKKFQKMLATHLGTIYDVKIPVINGDTKATSQRKPNETRLGMINEFCARDGFAICVLSPIAAGAGLNIVAANHVIHLERHWNPAKEDQATDRTYRIGQTKDVEVYLPLLMHPNEDLTTFDMGLHRLISKKRDVAGSVGFCPIQSVGGGELIDEVFGASPKPPSRPPRALTAESLDSISWQDFEALVAEIFARRASDAYLTPGGSDGGIDVVVLEDKKYGNMLVQCKYVSARKLSSDLAFRQILGAKPIAEERLGVSINNLAVFSSAQGLTGKSRRAARACDVHFFGRDWLKSSLSEQTITRAHLIKRLADRRSL